MNKEIWEKIESIYDQAIALDSKDKVQFVKTSSAGNDEIYQQVIKMLKSDDDFMEDYPGIVANEEVLENHELTSLGHFKIIKKVATGGMGRVYLAQSMNADVTIHVALKTIRVELINNELEKKFQNEKQILSKLKHKNIASLLDAGVSENKIPYIATEWIDGQNIINYCTENNLNIKSRLKLFQQICSAVSFAHNKLIIHRDIKPDNILVDSHGQVKLLDFGIAKIIDDNQSIKTQTQIYTPDYAAPEQINGELCTVETDVYSLGVVLFEILTNSKRFELSGLSISEKINAICSPKPIDIKNIHASLPYPTSHIEGALINIINKAMHIDQNRRYDNVASLAQDINNYITNRPVSAMKDSIFYKTKMFLIRNRLASFLTALIFIAVIIGLYVNNKQTSLKLKEAEKSQVMLGFFQNILKAASPSQGGSTGITVKQMFDLGIANYDFSSISDPYIRAELSSQIGLIYGQLGNPEKQKEYINNALSYYSEHLITPENIDSYLRFSTEIGGSYTFNQEYDKAQEYLLATLKKLDKLKLNQIHLAEIYLELAIVEKERNRYKKISVTQKSKDYLKKAETLAKEINSPMLLGEVDMYKHDYGYVTAEKAMAYIESAEKNFSMGSVGTFNPNLQNARAVKASLLSRSGKIEESARLSELIRKDTKAIYGDDDFIGIITLADIYNILGKYEKSKLLLEESLLVHKKYNLPKDPPYYGSLLYTANVLIEYQEFEKAERLFNESYEFFSKLLPENHDFLKISKSSKSILYLKSANDEQLKISQNLLEGYLLENKLQHKFKYSLFIKLGHINLYFKELNKANDYYNQAISVTLKNPGQFNQAKVYWELQTGLALTRIFLGENKNTQQFLEHKQHLLNMVSNDSWYDKFFSLDIK